MLNGRMKLGVVSRGLKVSFKLFIYLLVSVFKFNIIIAFGFNLISFNKSDGKIGSVRDLPSFFQWSVRMLRGGVRGKE